MASRVAVSADEHLQLSDVRRRVSAIFVGSIGNLVEWYDFYAYAAFALAAMHRPRPAKITCIFSSKV